LSNISQIIKKKAVLDRILIYLAPKAEKNQRNFLFLLALIIKKFYFFACRVSIASKQYRKISVGKKKFQTGF